MYSFVFWLFETPLLCQFTLCVALIIFIIYLLNLPVIVGAKFKEYWWAPGMAEQHWAPGGVALDKVGTGHHQALLPHSMHHQALGTSGYQQATFTTGCPVIPTRQ